MLPKAPWCCLNQVPLQTALIFIPRMGQANAWAQTADQFTFPNRHEACIGGHACNVLFGCCGAVRALLAVATAVDYCMCRSSEHISGLAQTRHRAYQSRTIDRKCGLCYADREDRGVPGISNGRN